ncbi:MAG: molybdopterin-guanine dinucleotide biosynthesis protein B [Archaeoglobaceae archaeon]|nr:molybdopterin-guanine dinucleotide biosynthesis protein B [Archaeoglobaceae archaeon]MCX8152214.1 molybdopterin-guanine dinucleotide biosynthesis protein B [Archaeoglobaceae archaeon]MDW8014000.1 molybdopterin-guanine dinucleotide biosynthesis protein B [Archaeoglobaceae archaeon]
MILSIVGSSGSGKTTLITRVVPILKKAGLKVAVVKNVHEDFEIDKEGKDSWKIYQSGADVLITSQKKLALIKRIDCKDLDELVERYLNDYDLVLTEGFSKAGKDRIVVVKEPEEVENFLQGKVVAVVCDKEVEGYVWFKREEVEKIANFILEIWKKSF